MTNPREVFYGDVLGTFGTEAASRTQSQSLLSFQSPSGPACYTDETYRGRRVYIHTKLDKALPPFLQNEFVEYSGVT